jgi:uncharacterized protein
LRGIALFGVLLGNFSEYILSGFIATSEQLAALGSAAFDDNIQFFIELLIADKANTLFSFLFGVSFSMQIQRLNALGEGAARVYLRRLVILLIFGFLHLFLLNPWDILHMYASLGFILFAFRRANDNTLLIISAFFLLFGTLIYRAIDGHFNFFRLLENYRFYRDSAILLRQSLSNAGEYWGLVTNLAEYTWSDWLLGSSGGSAFYLIGRFFLGAWVGRRDWLQNAANYHLGYKVVLFIALPVGIFLELIVLKTRWLLDLQRYMHTVATLCLSAGYVSAIIMALQSSRFKRLLAGFSDVGRMALTNYVLQSFIIGFTFWGILGGAGMAGKIGLTGVFVISIVGFAAIVLLSRVWLHYFAFGPLEWGWRCLTYQKIFPLRKAS